MATPQEKLAKSLEVLQSFQNEKRFAVIKSAEVSRTHRERLSSNGYIREVIKGWYISSAPDEMEGETSSWYTSYWDFISVYLNSRFSENWCLSAEQSLMLLGGNRAVPLQLHVRSPRARNKVTNLIHFTAINEVRADLPAKGEIESLDGINIYSLGSAIFSCKPDFFTRHPADARTALAMVKDPSGLVARLLDGGHPVIAGRLAGAFSNIGKSWITREIIGAMKTAGYNVWEKDPFKVRIPLLLDGPAISPAVNRIRILWAQMRPVVIDNFPSSENSSVNAESFVNLIEENYTQDAYHSLSIEGYRVNAELIERVRSGMWDPGKNKEDKEFENALAARGYYLAFQEVKNSIMSNLRGKPLVEIIRKDHNAWYRQLFSPAVTAGIKDVSYLAGYRNGPVSITNSLHSPPYFKDIGEMMAALFDLLRDEPEPSVRVVMGHFIFVYIHPYFDGNGRIARFIMNALLASGGYQWTIIPVQKRDEYMSALENASVRHEITDFALFLGKLVSESMIKKVPDGQSKP